MSDGRLIRLISSKDHRMSREELAEIIRRTGTDRYDSERKHIFHEYYGKHDFNFFAGKSDVQSLEEDILEAIQLFPARTKGDRGREVYPDIVIIYKSDACEELDGVYDYKTGSDCFRFRSNPLDALAEVRLI